MRIQVRGFRERTGHGQSIEHCFAPWYLHTVFHLPEEQALAQSSDGSHDYGIDAFHIDSSGGTPSTLILVQTKFTNSLNLVSKGFREMARCLPELKVALAGTGTDVDFENKVLVNLRATLNRLETDTRSKLVFDFRVVHLCEEDDAIIGFKTGDSRERLKEAIEKVLPDRSCTIRDVRPKELGPPVMVVEPPKPAVLNLEAIQMAGGTIGARMHYGIGRLSELVDLYTWRRDGLFSKNVRYFLFGKKAEKGPAGKMRETLKRICVKKEKEKPLDPEIFAMYHNGVTLYARRVEKVDGGIHIAEPFVLNGCQTIKAAFYFRNDNNLKDKIDEERWRQVRIPIRIVETNDEDLIRQITINNNRQNQISPVAFRANDPVQIRLEERFKERKIFYERQEGAYKNLANDKPELIEDEYMNTRGEHVQIEDIGRSIAAVSGKLGYAQRPNELFETDKAYEECFHQRKLQSLVFLTFLQNMHDVMGVVLKMDMNFPRENRPFSPAKLKYYAMNLLVRYLARKRDTETVLEFGTCLYGKKMRDDVRKWLNSSGIRTQLREKFWTLEQLDASSASDAFKHAEASLRLSDVDPFEVFANLDQELMETDY